MAHTRACCHCTARQVGSTARRARIVTLDGGSVRVRGQLSEADRERLDQTQFDTGRVIAGWTIWWPREVPDA